MALGMECTVCDQQIRYRSEKLANLKRKFGKRVRTAWSPSKEIGLRSEMHPLEANEKIRDNEKPTHLKINEIVT
jgi:hypothetical protein